MIAGTGFCIFNTSVVNNLKPVVVEYLNKTENATIIPLDSDTIWSIVVAAYTAGCAVGTISSPFIAEKVGRKIALMMSAILNTIGGIMCLFYLKVFEFSIGGRVLMGLAMGIGLPLASTFLTEISPVKYRGACNSMVQAGFAFGDFCGMTLSLPTLLGSESLSPFSLGFTGLTSFFMLIILFFAHDSPRYLILKMNNSVKGKEAITFYQGLSQTQEVFEEILQEKQMESFSKTESGGMKWSSIPFKNLLLACACFTIPMVSGIIIIIGYSTDAFDANGLPQRVTPYLTLTLGVSNCLSSFLSVKVVDRWGRKALMKIGLIGSFLGPFLFTIFSLINFYATTPSGFAYSLVIFLDLYVLSYSFLNASSITLAAEICSQSYRSYAMALGNFCSMMSATLLILTYEPIKVAFGVPWVFFPFNLLATCCGLVLFFAVPETTGVSLSDIKKQFLTSRTSI